MNAPDLNEPPKVPETWLEPDGVSDADLGHLVKRIMFTIQLSATQRQKAAIAAAALMICCDVNEHGAEGINIFFEGVTEGTKNIGNWTLTVRKESA